MCIILLAGWQNHPVCHNRWHIIVPVVEDMFVSATSTHDLPGVPPEGAVNIAVIVPVSKSCNAVLYTS